MFFADIAIAAAYGASEQFKLEEKIFEKSIADLTPEEKQAAREKRRLEKIEERRHRELCQAIRDSKPDNKGIGMAGLIFGACLAGSIADGDK